jgi:hypothetical protein
MSLTSPATDPSGMSMRVVPLAIEAADIAGEGWISGLLKHRLVIVEHDVGVEVGIRGNRLRL